MGRNKDSGCKVCDQNLWCRCCQEVWWVRNREKGSHKKQEEEPVSEAWELISGSPRGQSGDAAEIPLGAMKGRGKWSQSTCRKWESAWGDLLNFCFIFLCLEPRYKDNLTLHDKQNVGLAWELRAYYLYGVYLLLNHELLILIPAGSIMQQWRYIAGLL